MTIGVEMTDISRSTKATKRMIVNGVAGLNIFADPRGIQVENQL